MDIEIRRRLWAQICILDGRLAEQLCREPAINPDTYDIALPLSLTDQSLMELELQCRPAHQGSGANLTGFQEVERAQEHTVPFSPMALLIVEAETSRQQQQLLCLRYNPRDRPLRASSTSPQIAKRAIPFSGRADRGQWASELQNRFSNRYSWDIHDNSDPIRYLVAEICQINMLKVKLMGIMTQRRDIPSTNTYGNPEVLRYAIYPRTHQSTDITTLLSCLRHFTDPASIFRDALHLATRCAALMHQYSNSPYNWYTRRVREVYSCSFMAVVLSSDHQLGVEDASAAWSVLDQLFPADSSQRSMEPGMRDTLLEKVITKARMKKELRVHIPVGPHIGEQVMHSSAGGYAAHIAVHPPVSSSANFGQRTAYQSTGNIFEDWDSLVQEQIWPGSLPSDNNYWV